MSEKVEVEIAFWRKVKYSGTVMVTHEQHKLLEELEGDDVLQHLPPRGSYEPNPTYDLISDIATESNECDWEEELEDLEVNTYYQVDEN